MEQAPKPTIFELRGNGALVRVCTLATAQVQALHQMAERYGEMLEFAWFDPAFRWKKQVREYIDSATVIAEYRGLYADNRSFLEVRRFRKKRKKFLVEELLQTNLLFPLVQFHEFRTPSLKQNSTILIETTHGTGSLGQFETPQMNMAELSVCELKNAGCKEQLILLSAYENAPLECKKDDFLIRSTHLQIL